MMLGGSSTDCFVDDFVLKKVGSIVQDEDQPLFQTDFEQDNQMKDAYFDYSKNIWMKQGNGNDAAASFAIEQVADENGQDTNALLVSDRTSYARPIMRVDLPFEIGKTYRIAYAAKSKETGKKMPYKEDAYRYRMAEQGMSFHEADPAGYLMPKLHIGNHKVCYLSSKLKQCENNI